MTRESSELFHRVAIKGEGDCWLERGENREREGLEERQKRRRKKKGREMEEQLHRRGRERERREQTDFAIVYFSGNYILP